mgnify:FL=1
MNLGMREAGCRRVWAGVRWAEEEEAAEEAIEGVVEERSGGGRR